MTTTTVSLDTMGQAAKQASRTLGALTTAQKNAALHAIADAIEAKAGAVLWANAVDVEQGRERGLSDAMLDRLLLTPQRVQALADDTRKVADLHDPVGEELERRTMYNGMTLIRRRTPIGVLGVIYEARPNVTVDIAALSLKTGNAAILRGGSETLNSNKALIAAIQQGLANSEVPHDAIQYIDNPDRALVGELLRLDRYVDMIIPRGGAGLHQRCKEQSTIPVITGGIGICHIFVDETADLDRAVDIVENAKVQRPSVCNALDTLLVHEAVAGELLPKVAERLAQSGVELRVTEAVAGHLDGFTIILAEEGDFDQEWLGLTLGIDVVNGLDAAIAHIQAHSTEHSDSILTQTEAHATRFINEVNSAAVYVNASTRFTDGGEFGLGAEVAVSTQKLHARGPMGLEALTTYKWIGLGDGHIR
ncbi:MAG: glutamate-5-semialdehyde dehydrogenase [Rhodothermales bacterium]